MDIIAIFVYLSHWSRQCKNMRATYVDVVVTRLVDWPFMAPPSLTLLLLIMSWLKRAYPTQITLFESQFLERKAEKLQESWCIRLWILVYINVILNKLSAFELFVPCSLCICVFFFLSFLILFCLGVGGEHPFDWSFAWNRTT